MSTCFRISPAFSGPSLQTETGELKKPNNFETAEEGAAFVALPHFSPQRSSSLDCLCADADKPALGDLAFIYFARATALVAAAAPSLGSFSRSGLRSRAAACLPDLPP